MNLKKAYHYLFYKFFKLSESAPSGEMSDWKAELLMDIFVGLFLFSLAIYYNVHVDKHFEMPNNITVIGAYIIFVCLPNYFMFHHKDQWKAIVADFNKVSKINNRIGGWVVLLVSASIILNLIFAFYQMSKLDWSKY